jgi:hypothetical protein
MVIAHNFKGYDGQFILNYLVHTASIKPSVILNGSKILCLEIGGIKFIDSYNFLPFALAKMPSAFGLSELKKRLLSAFLQYDSQPELRGTLPRCTLLQSGRHASIQSTSLLHLVQPAKR